MGKSLIFMRQKCRENSNRLRIQTAVYNGGMLCASPSHRCSSHRPHARPCGRVKTDRAVSKPNRSCRWALAACISPGKARLKNNAAATNFERCYQGNQQYSITALTNGSGTIVERYAYDAYGTSTITDGSGTARTSSAENNRYTYTGREYDEALGVYHYRARMYDSASGRFCSRDPIGFEGSTWNLFEYVGSQPMIGSDPSGLAYSQTWFMCGGKLERQTPGQSKECCGGKVFSNRNYTCENNRITPKNPPTPTPPYCGYFCTRASESSDYFLCIGLGFDAEPVIYAYIDNDPCIAFTILTCDEFSAAQGGPLVL